MPIPITDQDFNNLIEALLGRLRDFWNRLTPEQRRQLESLYIALGQAINALRAGGLAGARANLIPVLEKLREFLAALTRLGGSEALKIRIRLIINMIGQFLKALGGETAAGAAAEVVGGSLKIGSVTITGITAVTVTALLIEIIAVLIGLFLWWEYCEKEAGSAPLPFGGPPCGATALPVARGLSDWDLSWGAVRSWNNLMDSVRQKAASYPCAGQCASGTCKGSPAITNWSQTRLFLGTYSSCTFDVYCECL
jgi:hypothetical protein